MLALGVLCLLVALLGGAAAWGLATLRESVRQTALDHQTSSLANQIVIQALLCRRYEKDFLLSAGDLAAQDAPLQQWHAASIELRGAIKAYEDAARSDADRRQAQTWRDDWTTYARGFGRLEIAVNQGLIKTSQDAIAILDPYQATIQRMTDQAVEVAEAKSRSALEANLQLEGVGRRILQIVLIAGALVLLASLACVLLFPRWLVKPISVLHEVAVRLASGDLSVRTGLQRGDEIGTLAQSFDHMAETIQRNQVDLETQYAAATASRLAAEESHRQIVEQLAMIAQQEELISELHVPILPLSDSALVLPLIGMIDSQRLQLAQERVLEAVKSNAARHLLLDITGVPVVDTFVAQGLIQMVQATRLLGCEVVLVGIRPEVAQAIVGLGLSFSDVVTRSTLQSGIAYTLQQSR